MPALRTSVTVALVAAVLAPTAGASPRGSQSANVDLVRTIPYTQGTDLDFSGDVVYAAQEGPGGGVHIIDVSGGTPRQVGFASCPGTQNDVAVVRRGLIALGGFSGTCTGAGIRLIDVRNPKAPKLLGQVGFPDGTHTLTVYPGTSLIYSSPGGLGENGGTEFIVDASDPRDLEVVGEYTPNAFGCHDVSFHVRKSRKLGFCPGQQETEVWDVSDPLHPDLLAEIPPTMEFPHSAIAAPDGEVLVIGDENLFTVHDCVTSQDPLGALWAYDISDPAQPLPLGYISSPRGALPVTGCTAHNFNFIPKTRTVVAAWYTGGTSVVDFADPTTPEEVAYFAPADVDTWSSYWYRGRIYANDLSRGLDVLTFTP